MPFFRLHPLRKYCTYSEFFCSECRKIRTTKTANTDTFHAEIRFGEKTEFQRKLIINLYTFLKYKKFLGEENNIFSLCKEYLGRNPNKHTVHVVRDLIAILRHYTRLPATFNTQSTHLCIHSTYFFEYLNKHRVEYVRMKFYLVRKQKYTAETYSQPCQTSRMELFFRK